MVLRPSSKREKTVFDPVLPLPLRAKDVAPEREIRPLVPQGDTSPKNNNPRRPPSGSLRGFRFYPVFRGAGEGGRSLLQLTSQRLDGAPELVEI